MTADRRVYLARRLLAPVLTVLIAAAAGYAFAALRLPLPWMTGPLVSVALLRLAGVPLRPLRGGRQLGQWIIGAALGLYFSPGVIGVIASLALFIVLGGVVAMLSGFASGYLLSRVAGVPFVTGFFGSIPAGATEMTVIGRAFGARADRVAAAQSLRIMTVVLLFPAIFQALGVHGSDPYEPAARIFSLPGFVVLAAVTGGAAVVLSRLRVRNAWVMGPLATAIPLTALGVTLSSIPVELSNAAQLLLGIALGASFERDFVRAAPRFLAAVAVSVGLSILIAAAYAAFLVAVTAMSWTTLGLATSPGGLAEMALTAKTLELGVPVVTAFHVTRMVMLVLLAAPVYAWVVELRAARASGGR